MEITNLNSTKDLSDAIKHHAVYIQFEELIKELNTKNLPDRSVIFINKNIKEINSSLFTGKLLLKPIVKKQNKILKFLQKEHYIVSHHYYRNLWMVLGMSVFGVPLGILFGFGLENYGLLGIGLPIGLIIGMVVGVQMDKKAKRENRQLHYEIKNRI